MDAVYYNTQSNWQNGTCPRFPFEQLPPELQMKCGPHGSEPCVFTDRDLKAAGCEVVGSWKFGLPQSVRVVRTQQDPVPEDLDHMCREVLRLSRTLPEDVDLPCEVFMGEGATPCRTEADVRNVARELFELIEQKIAQVYLDRGFPVPNVPAPAVIRSLVEEEPEPEDGMSDVEADADTFRSAGWGTDEDYTHAGTDPHWDGLEEGL